MTWYKKAQVGGLQGFTLSIVTIAIVLAIGLIVMSELQDTAKTLDTTSTINESVTLADISSTVSNESVTFGFKETVISNESHATTSESVGFTIALTYDNLTTFTELRNETADIVLGLCNATLPTGILDCNGTNSTNLYSDYTYISGRTGKLSEIPLSSLTALRNITSDDIIGECDVSLSDGILTCNNTHSYQAYADYAYKNYSTGGLSQSDLFVSAGACRNSSMNTVILGTHCNVSGGTVTVFPLNFSDGIVYVDYSHYTPSAAYNSSRTLITKLAIVPTWLGIIVIVALSFIVLSYFLGKRQ